VVERFGLTLPFSVAPSPAISLADPVIGFCGSVAGTTVSRADRLEIREAGVAALLILTA